MSVDFIGIGAQKCGTTWLAKMLKEHPQVYWKGGKEFNFFNDRFPFYTKTNYNNYSKGIKWYLEELGSKKGKIVGEFSTNYMWDPLVAKRIKENFPKTKIIAVLRDPVERAYSQYLFAGQLFYIAKDFDSALKKYPEFIERGMYYKQLKPYFDLFPKKNIKVIIYEDLKDKPIETIREVEKFLGIKDFIPKDYKEKSNVSVEVRHNSINKIVTIGHKVKNTKFGKFLWNFNATNILSDKISSLILKYNSKPKTKPKISNSVRKKLQKTFESDTKKLEKLISKDLSHWKN